ncbi:hypothetical protein [Paenibacillus sp. NPDC058071]|uniref:hypothetical protein n=1 Tax=Paenibacillus sp. NPDC058071 TaxID=3346326 RepID=UPI0036DD4E9B
MQVVQSRKALKIHVALVFVLIVSLLLPALASTSEAAASNAPQPVYITSNSYVKLENADVMPSSKGRTASFTVTFYNGSNAPINLQDYWFRLSSVSGTKYIATLVESDKSKKSVPAKSSITLTYYSEVPSNVSLSDLVLRVVKFDFSVAGYERTLGKFNFSSSYNNAVKVNGYKSVKLNNTNINIRVNKATISKGTDNNIINLELAMRNTGNYETLLSNMGFFIQASNGSMYQMKTSTDSSQGLLLRPQILEKIKLTITLPKAVSTNGQKLIVSQSLGEAAASVTLPVAKFNLSLSANNTSATTTEYEYVKDDYTYKVKVDSLQRYTWMGQDNLITKLTITNKSSKSAPVPAITGSFYLGDNAEIQTKKVPLDSQLSIASNGSVTAYYSATVPTTTNLAELKVKLFEKEGETNRELAALRTTAVSTPKSIALGDTNNLNDLGVKLGVKVTNVKLLQGSANNLLAIYVDATNNQDFATATTKLLGYIETATGSKYNTTLIKSDTVIGPSKKEQVILTAEVPKNADLKGAALVLGVGYNDEGITKANETPAKGFINATSYALPEADQTTNDFSKIKIGAYTVNIDNIITYLNDVKADIDLNGQVSRDFAYEAFSSKKFTVVIEDESINSVMVQVPIELEGTTGQYVWKLGNNYNNIVQDLSSKSISQTIQLNVYEEINGYKTKLVSRTIRWSPYLNWANPDVK